MLSLVKSTISVAVIIGHISCDYPTAVPTGDSLCKRSGYLVRCYALTDLFLKDPLHSSSWFLMVAGGEIPKIFVFLFRFY